MGRELEQIAENEESLVQCFNPAEDALTRTGVPYGSPSFAEKHLSQFSDLLMLAMNTMTIFWNEIR